MLNSLFFCKTYYCVSDISWFDWNITSICHLQACFSTKPLQKSRGTRTLVPFHVNQQVFVFISRMGFRNITLSFSSECVYMFLTLPDFVRTLPVKMRIRNKANATKNCGGTRSLVPFQVDNWVFIVISRMNIRIINLSFIPSVFMCSWRFLVISEYCQ